MKKSENLKIISWNINGLRATYKNGLFLPIIIKEKPDIFCLQETKAEIEQLPEELKNLHSYFSYFVSSKKRKGYSGLAIYSKIKPETVLYGMGKKEFDDEGRFLALIFKDFIIINTYCPNGGSGPDRLEYKLAFYEYFLKFIQKLRKINKNIIFCGDINTAHNPIDLARPKANEKNTGFLPIERAWIDKVIKNNYIDIFRHFYPQKKDSYTYWDQKTGARARNVGWRLDYFFVTKEFLPKIKKTEILNNILGSDHCPISLEVEF